MPIHSLDRDVEERLSDRDVRYTRGRRRVVAALHEADGPMSAAELHGKVGADVPLSSLYRTLAVLEETEVVMPHFGARGITRYELAEWLTGHHHHLVCVDCGTVDDINVPPQHEAAVRVLVEKIAAAAAFSPSAHVLEIEGSCSRCR
ncbi:MAG: transcriptional repressor [bacterium]|nr:transcriptional repressor [bacterium]MCP4965755.1 transcriptional repressor [bacterium]